MDETTRRLWLRVLLDDTATEAERVEAAHHVLLTSPLLLARSVEGYLREVTITPRQARRLPPLHWRTRLVRHAAEVTAAAQVALEGHPEGWRVMGTELEVLGEGGAWVPRLTAIVAASPQATPSVEGLATAWLPHGALADLATHRGVGVRPLMRRALFAAGGIPGRLAEQLLAAIHRGEWTPEQCERALTRLAARVARLPGDPDVLPLPLRLSLLVADVAAVGEVRAPRALDAMDRLAWYWAVRAWAMPAVQAAIDLGRPAVSRFDVLEVLELLQDDVSEATWDALDPRQQHSIQLMGHWLQASQTT